MVEDPCFVTGIFNLFLGRQYLLRVPTMPLKIYHKLVMMSSAWTGQCHPKMQGLAINGVFSVLTNNHLNPEMLSSTVRTVRICARVRVNARIISLHGRGC